MRFYAGFVEFIRLSCHFILFFFNKQATFFKKFHFKTSSWDFFVNSDFIHSFIVQRISFLFINLDDKKLFCWWERNYFAFRGYFLYRERSLIKPCKPDEGTKLKPTTNLRYQQPKKKYELHKTHSFSLQIYKTLFIFSCFDYWIKLLLKQNQRRKSQSKISFCLFSNVSFYLITWIYDFSVTNVCVCFSFDKITWIAVWLIQMNCYVIFVCLLCVLFFFLELKLNFTF